MHTARERVGCTQGTGRKCIRHLVMLSKDFLKLVFIGFVTATPVTWYLMNQ